MDGGIFTELLGHIDLPETYARKKLSELVSLAGKNPEDLSLEDLREAVASYMQDVLLEMKAR